MATGSSRPTTGDGRSERWEARRPDLVLLDLGLPDMDGLRLVRRWRREATTPIVILSSRFEERDKVEALEQGADDYVTKPVGMDELDARVRVALRHAAGPAADLGARIRVGPLVLDSARHEVTVAGTAVDLTPREFEILRVLLTPPGSARDQGPAASRGLGRGLPGRVQLRVRPRQPAASQAGGGRPRRVPARPHRQTEPGVGYRVRAPDEATDLSQT